MSVSSVKDHPLRYNEPMRLRIAVIDFDNKTGDVLNDSLVGSISSLLVPQLQNTRSFIIVDEQEIKTVLAELKLNESWIVDPQKVRKVGKTLGVDAFLFGNLVSVQIANEKKTIAIMWTEVQKIVIRLDAQLVNFKTSEIMAKTSVESFVKEKKWVGFGFIQIGQTSDRSAAIQTAFKPACKQMAVNLAVEIAEKKK